jgi:hypothetical protein
MSLARPIRVRSRRMRAYPSWIFPDRSKRFDWPRPTKLAYDCRVVSVRGGAVMTADGLSLGTQPVSTLDNAHDCPDQSRKHS